MSCCSEFLGHATVAHFFPFSSSFHPPSLLSAFSPCPVTELSVWTDCDIGCVGDRLAGVISEGEKNISGSLYLTPFHFHQPLMEEGLVEIAGNVFHLFFKRWLSVLESIFEFNVSLNFSERRKKLMQKVATLSLKCLELLMCSQPYKSLLHIIIQTIYQVFPCIN